MKMVEVDKTFRERLIDFTFYCRERQFMLGPQDTREAFEIAERGYWLDRKVFQYSLKAIFCSRKEHFDRFDEMFDRFWSRYYEEKLEERKKTINQIRKEPDTDTIMFLGARFNKPRQEKDEKEAKQTRGANESMRLRFTDFSKVDVADRERLEELAEDCEKLDYVQDEPREVPDLKAAISNSMGFGGHNIVVSFTGVE